ncbi:UNVERIFIED_CONTAM: hypothetical protein HDU68_007042 [Siphonaria sp. JEL0065]|nr:hypothetical protein HDU68_007042 [Siphonaria sp. JEL0065]
MPLCNNILECVGNTHVGKVDEELLTIANVRVLTVKINNLAPDGITMWVKIESSNPAGSIKDRIAVGMVQAAERDGLLTPGSTIIESTAGNTGIGLAMVAASCGYSFIAVISDKAPPERVRILKFLGAKVLLTPRAMPATLRNKLTQDLAAQNGWFCCEQPENPSNPDTHRTTTAVEILRDFQGVGLDYFVSGYGTGGTISGVAKVLKKERPGISVVICEPATAPMLSKGVWESHGITGWTPDFIPHNLDTTCYDQIVSVTDQEAHDACHSLARKEGIMCGISGGAAFASALKVAQTAKRGSTFLVMLPDSAERYFGSRLFEGIPVESDTINGYEEWKSNHWK